MVSFSFPAKSECHEWDHLRQDAALTSRNFTRNLFFRSLLEADRAAAVASIACPQPVAGARVDGNALGIAPVAGLL
jgi:hypothetical protein